MLIIVNLSSHNKFLYLTSCKMILIITLFAIFLFFAIRHKNSLKYSKFPSGPRSFPIFGSIFSLGAKPHEKLSELKAKFGNVISIDFGSRRAIILNDADTIKQAFSLKQVQHRPDTEVLKIIRGGNLTGIGFSSGRTNEEQRAFVIKILKNFGMGKKSMEFLLVEELQRLFTTLDQQLGIPLLNKEIFQVTAVSALWRIMTGEHSKEKDPEFLTMMHNIRIAGTSFNSFTLFLPTLSKLFPNLSGWNNLTQGGLDLYNYVGKTIKLHKDNFNPDKEPNDLVEAYLQKIEITQDEKSTFFGENGYANLKGVLTDFLGAGTDNIGTCLTWFLSVAVYYPEIQKKTQSEIFRVTRGNRFPSLADRTELPYIEAIVLEILRFSASIPLGVPHAASEDVEFEGYIIPKGTVVISNAYDALHDPKRWDDPETFKPERFLSEDGSAIERNIARNVDIIFGHGKRICPGEALAKDEIFLFIAGLSQRYTFERDPQWNYGDKVKTELGISLVPIPHTIIINKQ